MSASFDESMAGHPLERRLNRIERVAAAYRGRIEKSLENGRAFTFETADAAVLAACEMQHRCAALPQVSAQRLSLRIGVHQTTARERSRDSDATLDETAAHLAAVNDTVVASERVYTALNLDLRGITRPISYPASAVAGFQIDWRREIPASAYGGESFWPTHYSATPTPPYLRLSYGMKSLELTAENPVVTVGRDPSCDLVLTGVHVSRNHCRIERKIDRIVLIDRSTNGTCIATDEGKARLIKNASLALYGNGLLFFGRPFNGERRGGARFESL
ncbi:MAG: FHA domain-containing protein [Propionivibrio sp.]